MRSLALIALLVAPLVAGVDAQTKPRVSAAWYAGWHANATDFPLSSVSWHKYALRLCSRIIATDPGCRYTHMMYSFAETTPSVNHLTLNGSDGWVLPQFVKTAQKNVSGDRHTRPTYGR
jgi:chitinase